MNISFVKFIMGLILLPLIYITANSKALNSRATYRAAYLRDQIRIHLRITVRQERKWKRKDDRRGGIDI